MRRRANLTRRVLAFELADIFFGILPRRLAYVLMTIVGWVVATCFKGRVAGLVAVGVDLHGGLAVRALQLLAGAGSLDTEHLVVVALHRRHQWRSEPRLG